MAVVVRHNLPCAFCKVEFFPNYDRWVRWRKGEPTYCSRRCVQARYALDAHARNPDQPCTTCGKVFTLTRSQKHKIKTRSNTGLYCSTECLHKSRETNPRKQWSVKRGENYFTARTCGQCHKEFVPTPRQRQWGARNSEARSFCSIECDHEWRSAWMRENISSFPRPEPVRGPDNPHWKHGLYSTDAREAYKLRTKINRLTKEGARA
jgi:hypothetical protein